MLVTIKDGLNLLSKMTIKKAWNAAKVLTTYYISKWSKAHYKPAMPIAIAFEPTTTCNLKCPECPSGLRAFSRPTGNLSVDLFEKTILEIKDTLLYLTFYFQGEPYLHPQFLDMVSFAKKHKIYTATSTNAHYLTEKNAEKTVKSGLDRLIISIDGTSQETYQSYRVGGKLEKVIQGTKNILEARKKLKSKTPQVLFQFLVVKPNQHQIQEVKALGKSLGVDKVALKTAQIYDYENGSDLIPTIDKYARYTKQKDGKYKIKGKQANSCWKMWHSCVITWDGRVVPCCFDKDATHVLGTLDTHSFKQIWYNQEYVRFRKLLLSSRKKVAICTNCTEGTKVWS